jgi:hypothetical protein
LGGGDHGGEHSKMIHILSRHNLINQKISGSATFPLRLLAAIKDLGLGFYTSL